MSLALDKKPSRKVLIMIARNSSDQKDPVTLVLNPIIKKLYLSLFSSDSSTFAIMEARH
jgi:hypothetical protein